MWYLLQTIHSCKRDRKLTTTTCNMQQTISIALIPSLMSSFNSSGVSRVFVQNFAVNCPQTKWQDTERLGQLAAQAMLPKRKITLPENTTLAQPIESRAVCVVAPSCWKKAVTIDVISIHFSLLQHCSVSCWGYGHCTFLKEVGPIILKADTPHQTVAFEVCAGISKTQRDCSSLQYRQFCLLT
jgi:hypothetical protein